MYIRDLNGHEYAVQATVTIENELNGNQSLSGDIEYTEINAEFLSNLDRLWELYDHNDVGYKIITVNKQGKGEYLKASFKAVPLFFDYMDTHSIMDSNTGDHHIYNGNMSAKQAAGKIFNKTPFDYVLIDSFGDFEWDKFGGGESRLETFKRWLENYNAEFELNGSTVELKKQAGRDTSIQYHHRLNANNIKQDIDASEQYTIIRGYGDFGNGTGENSIDKNYTDARLKRKYKSPLADIIGKRYSPPIIDGNITDKSEMDRKLKNEVENSLKVSVSADIVNLSAQGYPIDQSRAGDRVFLIDERIGFNEEVRIVSQKITRNWRGEVTDADITFGSERLGKRHQSKIDAAADKVDKVMKGKEEIPLSGMDRRVKEISNIINGNSDSIFKYTPNGIIGWNGDDPNYMTKYVGDAIGFSDDGGNSYKTAMSADKGIVAEYIKGGKISGVTFQTSETNGKSIHMRDQTLTMYKNDLNKFEIGFRDENNNEPYMKWGSGKIGKPKGKDSILRLEKSVNDFEMLYGTKSGNSSLKFNYNGSISLRSKGTLHLHADDKVVSPGDFNIDGTLHVSGRNITSNISSLESRASSLQARVSSLESKVKQSNKKGGE